jgi:hypothetical protein
MNPAEFLADPVAAGAIVGALALILFAAASHKLSQADEFAGALQAYALLPASLVPAATRTLPALEIGIGIAMLVPFARTPGLLAAAALLLVYASAMAINLLRGRREIDCGCGGEAHPLSWALVLRNAILAGAGLAVAGPAKARDFDWLDGVILLIGVLAFYALYLLFDELLKQFSRIAQLRSGNR